MVANKQVLDSAIESVPHMEGSCDVRRRNDHGVGVTSSVKSCLKCRPIEPHLHNALLSSARGISSPHSTNRPQKGPPRGPKSYAPTHLRKIALTFRRIPRLTPAHPGSCSSPGWGLSADPQRPWSPRTCSHHGGWEVRT